jgi:hypothetical protein
MSRMISGQSKLTPAQIAVLVLWLELSVKSQQHYLWLRQHHPYRAAKLAAIVAADLKEQRRGQTVVDFEDALPIERHDELIIARMKAELAPYLPLSNKAKYALSKLRYELHIETMAKIEAEQRLNDG